MRHEALHFEALKAHLKQDKNGHVLSLVIHPNDTPEAIWRWPVGQRFMVALAPMDDNEPVPEEGRKALSSLRSMCRTPSFQTFFRDHYQTDVIAPRRMEGKEAEDWTLSEVKLLLGISSSSEIQTNEEARIKWKEMQRAYNQSAYSGL